jgi:hypothetical protein
LEADGIKTDAVLAQIRSLQTQRFYEQHELEQCLRSSNVHIIGVESTQAIQSSRGLPGQGGFGGTNTVPLVAQKLTVLRVYVNVTDLPDRLSSPTQITGTATLAGPRGTLQLNPINGPIAALNASMIQRGIIDHTELCRAGIVL